MNMNVITTTVPGRDAVPGVPKLRPPLSVTTPTKFSLEGAASNAS